MLESLNCWWEEEDLGGDGGGGGVLEHYSLLGKEEEEEEDAGCVVVCHDTSFFVVFLLHVDELNSRSTALTDLGWQRAHTHAHTQDGKTFLQCRVKTIHCKVKKKKKKKGTCAPKKNISASTGSVSVKLLLFSKLAH